MPVYPGATGATVSVNNPISPVMLSPGDSAYLFGKLAATATQLPVNDQNVAFETITAGQASISACITPSPGPMNTAPSIGVELVFSGAPGAFEMDVMEADTDADAFYVTPTNVTFQITAVNATTFIARADLSPTGGRFIRFLMKTLTNAVNVKAKLTLQ